MSYCANNNLCTLSYRDFLDRSLSNIDFNVLINKDCFKFNTNDEYNLQRKKELFPVFCEYIGTVLGYKFLITDFPREYPNCCKDETLYLEIQNNNCCWMHCLFAVLGESIHTHFTWSPWIGATLTSFIEFEMGTEEALEPYRLSEMGLSSSNLLAEILAFAEF